MSTRKNNRRIQGPSTRHGKTEFQYWQDIIFDRTGVSCTIRVTSTSISIRARGYADFVLAKSAISGKATVPIVRDFMGEMKLDA